MLWVTPSSSGGTDLALPGWDWLADHLASLNESSGGFETLSRHPVNAGAVFLGEIILVLAWVLALPFRLVYSAAHWALHRRGA